MLLAKDEEVPDKNESEMLDAASLSLTSPVEIQLEHTVYDERPIWSTTSLSQK